jgi:hypothetical protein
MHNEGIVIKGLSKSERIISYALLTINYSNPMKFTLKKFGRYGSLRKIIWMKNVTEDGSSHDCLDTYACLLLKNGDKKMARKIRKEIAKAKV